MQRIKVRDNEGLYSEDEEMQKEWEIQGTS